MKLTLLELLSDPTSNIDLEALKTDIKINTVLTVEPTFLAQDTETKFLQVESASTLIVEKLSDAPKKDVRHTVIKLADSYLAGELFSEEDKVSTSEDSIAGYLKIPVAVLGEWVHPEYGQLKFTEIDFDNIMKNFDNEVTGYEPGMYKGHDVNPNVADGSPSYAFLEQLEQIDDVLYGYWACNDAETYDAVVKGQFRYSSSELFRNAKSKETGEDLGTVLTGIALTNKPFLTRLPRVEAIGQKLSDCTPDSVGLMFPLSIDNSFKSNQIHKMPDTMIPSPEVLVGLTTTEVVELVKLSEPKSVVAEAVAIQEILTSATSDASEARIEALEKIVAEYQLSDRLNKIKSLNLSAATKQSFSDKITTGKISIIAADELLGTLSVISGENDSLLLNQAGTSIETLKVANPQIFSEASNPYQHIIDKNEAVLQSRQGQFI